jgi:HSP20 family molecular chaperone IbpA
MPFNIYLYPPQRSLLPQLVYDVRMNSFHHSLELESRADSHGCPCHSGQPDPIIQRHSERPEWVSTVEFDHFHVIPRHPNPTRQRHIENPGCEIRVTVGDVPINSGHPNPTRQQHGENPGPKPKFEVREDSEAFFFHGEVPGVTRENINIKFPTARVMTISGRVERNYQQKPRSRRQATVEDVDDEEWSNASRSRPGTPASTASSEVVPEPDVARCQISERRFGPFNRSFKFNFDLDHEEVTSELKDGILCVVVPKKVKPRTHRIFIN